MSQAVNNTVDLDNLLSREAVDFPFEFYAQMRAESPVYWNKRWNGWVVTGYQEVVDGFRNHATLSSDRFAGPFGEELSAASSQYQQLFGFLNQFFVWKDQPYHTRVRALVNKAFTPRSVEKLRPRLEDQLLSIARSQVEGSVKRYNRGVRWEQEQLEVHGTRWVSMYLPVWLYSYHQPGRNGGMLHYIAVNGRTGETMGSVPVQQWKMLLAALATGTVIEALAIAFLVAST